ncbi:MAG: response regulator transcription factor [Clostridia bacterium]|nr:response regulator transcription factor [Clostridia bacterium]
MTNIRTLIADDDIGMRLIMRKFIERGGGFEIVGEAQNGEELVRLHGETKPDVVFLDVEMPHLTGVEAAKIIQDVNPKTILVFATAHEDYRKDAFEVYAFDYLTKPFKMDRVMTTLEMIKTRFFQTPERKKDTQKQEKMLVGQKLMLKHKEGIAFADVGEILLVQREERSTVIELSGGKRLVTSEGLSDIEKRLPSDRFLRTHKSYIVGLDHVEAITPYGRWTYIVQLRGTERDALITAEKLDELEKIFR